MVFPVASSLKYKGALMSIPLSLFFFCGFLHVKAAARIKNAECAKDNKRNYPKKFQVGLMYTGDRGAARAYKPRDSINVNGSSIQF